MSSFETDSMRAERHLAAILAADVVGYSRQMERDEVGTLRRLRDLRQNLIEPKVAEHRGRIFKTMGDGFLAEFVSALDAVHCAVDIQRLMAARNLDLPEEGRLQLRIGINLGDVFHEGEDVFGDGVNIAARLESLAPPGGIYISRTACDPIRERFAFDFEDLGEHRVKNISRPIQVFGVRIEGAAGRGSTESSASPQPTSEQADKTIGGHSGVLLRLPALVTIGGLIAAVLLIATIGLYFGARQQTPPQGATSPVANGAPPVHSVERPSAPSPDAPPLPAPPAPDPEIVFWQSIENSKTAADFEEYLRKFPQGQFTDLAHNRLDALHSTPTAQTAAFSQPRPAPPPVERTRQFAAERSLPLPVDLRIIPPAADVGAGIAQFSGVWGGDGRWGGKGRQTMIVIEAVERSGRAVAVYTYGPPHSFTYDQTPARWYRTFGTIEGNTLGFEYLPDWKVKLLLHDNRQMFGVTEPNVTKNPPFKGSQIWFSRIQ